MTSPRFVTCSYTPAVPRRCSVTFNVIRPAAMLRGDIFGSCVCCVTWRLPCFRSVWWLWTAGWEVWTAGITSVALTTDGICLCVWPSRFANYKRCEMGNCSSAVATIILSVQVLSQRARATDHWVVQCTHTHSGHRLGWKRFCVFTLGRGTRALVWSFHKLRACKELFSETLQRKCKWALRWWHIYNATMMSSGETGVGSSTVLSSFLPLLEINHTSVTWFFLQNLSFSSQFLDVTPQNVDRKSQSREK